MTSSVAAVHSSIGKYWYLFVIVFACILVLYCVAFVWEYLKKDDRILQVVRPWRVLTKMIILQVCACVSELECVLVSHDRHRHQVRIAWEVYCG